ncbi:MAG: hypothetical protein LUC50_07520, partial [Ruminococcus sp.]|nr:hypothetical protein [Ruminococcus sp.]
MITEIVLLVLPHPARLAPNTEISAAIAAKRMLFSSSLRHSFFHKFVPMNNVIITVPCKIHHRGNVKSTLNILRSFAAVEQKNFRQHRTKTAWRLCTPSAGASGAQSLCGIAFTIHISICKKKDTKINNYKVLTRKEKSDII